MKFLVLSPYVPFPADHGTRIRSGVLVRALQELGDVEIASPVEPDEATNRAAAELGVALHALGTHDDHTSVGQKLGHWLRRRSDLVERRWSDDAREQVRALIAGGEFEAVVVDSTFAFPLLPRALELPYFLHLHNVESSIFSRGARTISGTRERTVRSIEGRMLSALEGEAAAKARLTITVSERERELVRALAPGAEVAVVRNSIEIANTPLLPPRSDDGPPHLLFVGSFDFPPNVEAAHELLRVHLPMLRGRHPDLALTIVGRDPEHEVGPVAREARAEATGFVEDLAPYYERATASYVPIRSGYGTRIKAIEAFAHGRPLLSTRLGVEGLGVVEGEHYLSCDTPEEGLRSLDLVLAGDAAPIVAAARAMAEQRFDNEVAIEKLRDWIAHGLT